ncbi:hypothetical protein PsYK624_165980 [Phanerochaete sordida]|uniref:CCHC-type domain-containing protein n=1 Tax=Phanerochaete sordida TaxID=48140 RepID=A0A9P3GRS4_9APHY|nr:hypothetical protein PsYK624_165980 [Phanerochaete sordida]
MSPPGVSKLNGTNFEVWVILIHALLTRKGLEAVAFGELSKPETGPNSKGVKEWERKNKESMAEIILHVEETELSHLQLLPTAYEMIEELTRMHRPVGNTTRMSMRRRFHSVKLKPDQSMASYIAEVRTLAQRLRALGVTVNDEDIILALTMGLPRAYDMFVVTLDAMPTDELTLPNVISRLLNEESRHVAVATAEETLEESAAAAVTKAAAKRTAPSNAADAAVRLARITCYNCGEKGHYQANCSSPRSAPVAKVAEAHAASVVVAPRPTRSNIVEIDEEFTNVCHFELALTALVRYLFTSICLS